MEELVKKLRDKDAVVRRKAVEKLIEKWGKNAAGLSEKDLEKIIEGLINALKDKKSSVRRAALDGLKKINLSPGYKRVKDKALRGRLSKVIHCKGAPEWVYRDAYTFEIWYGGYPRAKKLAESHARALLWRIANDHRRSICRDYDDTCPNYVGCDCHPGQFYPHRMVCAAACMGAAVLWTRKTWKTWAGTSAGKYTVGVVAKCRCECTTPKSIGEPFDFLGLINIIAGGLKGSKKWPQYAKDIADLINWLKKNL